MRRQQAEGKGDHQETEPDDNGRTPDHVAEQRRAIRPILAAAGEGKSQRHAHDPEEAGENHVGRRPAVPGRMLQWRIEGAPRTGIVHEQHAGDGRTAKGIE